MNTLTELTAEQVCYAYKGHTVLHGVSLSVREGELVSLLGKNGAGKTTLLKIMQGFLTPSQGQVTLNQKPLQNFSRRELARHIAYVPQSHIPPFPYTTEEVVLLGRIPWSGFFSRISDEDKAVVNSVLALLQIHHLARRIYTELSGGERQLVLIARALAQGARILIMDEPVTGLDYGNQFRLLDTLEALVAQNFGILMTTHHPEHALRVSSRVALLNEGEIQQTGCAEMILTSSTIHKLYNIHVETMQIHGQTIFIPA